MDPITALSGKANMKVSELIKRPAALDQNLEVYCYEEGPFPIPTAYPGPFEVCDLSTAEVQVSRDSGGKPLIEFGADGRTKTVAILGITSDF
jgi:hypothetical protein